MDTVYCMLLLGLDPIPRFQSLHLNIGPVTNTFLSFFFGVFPMPWQKEVFLETFLFVARMATLRANSKCNTVKHGLVVANTCLGYGSGMDQVWNGVWNEKC